MVSNGLLKNGVAYRAMYIKYITNALLGQLFRIELGAELTEAHTINRYLIANWALRNGRGAIKRIVDGPRIFYHIEDYDALRDAFRRLLEIVQGVITTVDEKAGADLIDEYTSINQEDHKMVLTRREFEGRDIAFIA
jgi:dipeptidyl-peptidase-3